MQRPQQLVQLLLVSACVALVWRSSVVYGLSATSSTRHEHQRVRAHAFLHSRSHANAHTSAHAHAHAHTQAKASISAHVSSSSTETTQPENDISCQQHDGPIFVDTHIPKPHTLVEAASKNCSASNITIVGNAELHNMFVAIQRYESPHLPFGKSMFTVTATREHPMKVRLEIEGTIHGVFAQPFGDYLERVMDFCQKFGYGMIMEFLKVDKIRPELVHIIFDGILSRSRDYGIPISVFYDPNKPDTVMFMKALADLKPYESQLLSVEPYLSDHDISLPSTTTYSR